MKVFLSGPMTGHEDFNYPAFARAAAELRGRGFDVVSPHELFGGDTSQPWDWYMRKSIAALVECDGVVLLPDWSHSRGARIEHQLAVAIDMRVMWLDTALNVKGQ